MREHWLGHITGDPTAKKTSVRAFAGFQRAKFRAKVCWLHPPPPAILGRKKTWHPVPAVPVTSTKNMSLARYVWFFFPTYFLLPFARLMEWEIFFSCIAAAACFFQVVAAGGTFARYSSISSSSIKSVLGRNLSSKASIVVPTDANFVNASSRWNEWETPQVVAVVEVFTESDVLATVREFSPTLKFFACE